MADLKLLPLLDAADPARLAPTLDLFLRGGSGRVSVETTCLHPPFCYWAVYRRGNHRATLKSFFWGHDYRTYGERLADCYPDRLGEPAHPAGGLVFLPEINGVLWGFPLDPSMPHMAWCLDGAWIAEALKLSHLLVLEPAVVDYSPETGAVFSYRHPGTRQVVAYGKCTPEDTCGLTYVVMDQLWHSAARRQGRLHLAQPLAFRPEAGLLLQAPIPGGTIGSHRNQQIFMQLVKAAASSLAAIHSMDIPAGSLVDARVLRDRLQGELGPLVFAAPALHGTLRRLLYQLDERIRRAGTGWLVPSHGDFKWDQFLHHRGRFALIDFELFCRAEPELDLGTFCAYLPPPNPHDWAEAAAAEALRSAFLRAYAEASSRRIDLERLALYEPAALALRGLAHVWAQQPDWQLRASQMVDLALERLVNPEPQELRPEKLA